MGRRRLQAERPTRAARRSRALMLLAAALLFAGLFAQITMLARISAQNKRAAALEREIVELGALAENLELSINQYHNLEVIAARARQMGMEQPDETQIRVVSVTQSGAQDTSTQTAEAIGGEKVLN